MVVNMKTVLIGVNSFEALVNGFFIQWRMLRINIYHSINAVIIIITQVIQSFYVHFITKKMTDDNKKYIKKI